MVNRRNSFDFARFVAASGVLFSHHFAINGRIEPALFGITLGYASVVLFFYMSGYLIYSSLVRNRSLSRFVAARVLRILPNLVLSLVSISVFLLVYFGNYSNAADHLRYVAQNILMLLQGSTRFTIIGIFEGRPYEAINGSLWTLPYEIWCYAFLFLIYRLAGSRLRFFCLYAALTVSIGAWFFTDQRVPMTGVFIHYMGSLAPFFFAGAITAAHGSQVPIISSPRMHWFSRGGDASYGIYIFAWPVQQLCSIWIADFYFSLAAAFLATVAIGYLTWHFLEKRCMSNVDRLAMSLRQGAGTLTGRLNMINKHEPLQDGD
jgi:peptidoglycan/LPS O-acetylase OafA/YrhL